MSGIKITTKCGEVEFGVLKILARKSRCLYVQHGGTMNILAYFRSDKAADDFQEVIDFIVKNLGPCGDAK